MNDKDLDGLTEVLRKLNLTTMLNHHEQLAEDAARNNLGYLPYLKQLADIETQARSERSIERRVKNAGFPIIKTLVPSLHRDYDPNAGHRCAPRYPPTICPQIHQIRLHPPIYHSPRQFSTSSHLVARSPR